MRPLWKFSSTFLFHYSVSSLCLSRTYSLSLICIHIQVSMDITLWHCRQTVDKFQAPHWNTNPLSWNAIRNVLQSQNIFEYYCLRDYTERTGHNGIYICVSFYSHTHTPDACRMTIVHCNFKSILCTTVSLLFSLHRRWMCLVCVIVPMWHCARIPRKGVFGRCAHCTLQFCLVAPNNNNRAEAKAICNLNVRMHVL